MKQFGEGKRPFNFFLNPYLRAQRRKAKRRREKSIRRKIAKAKHATA